MATAAPVVALVVALGVAAASASGAARPKFTATALAPDGAPVDASKSRLGQIATSDPALLKRTDSALVNVMVKLDYDSVASYTGNVPGYAATSPKKTGKKLKDNKAAVTRYKTYVAGQEQAIVARVRAAVSGEAVRASYRVAYGGVSMRLPASEAKKVAVVDGVVAIQSDDVRSPLTDTTPGFLGASAVWPSLGGPNKAGEGVIVGVLDTGIWPEHPSFQDPGISGPAGSFACEFGGGLDPELGPSFTCNDKLIGAYAFVDTYLAVVGHEPDEFCTDTECSARDADGHGTHTTSTAAGAPVANATLLGVSRGPVSGMAPGAHVIAYRVCLSLGCFSSDSVAAVEQAIVDGVDVINFSISGGASPYTDPVELAFLEAYAAGITVNASAGNEGPGPGTANHGGPWVNTVAASTSPRSFLSTLHLTATGGATLDLPGVTVTAGITSGTPVVPNIVDPLCLAPAAPGVFTGQVVVCRRGVNARVDKGFNVLQGGAAGMILYNPAVQQLNSDSHWLPAIHIEGPVTGTTGDAAKLIGFMTANTGVEATWANGAASPAQADVIASFSSRGPLGDFMKPDVTAPGIQILAGMTPDPVDVDTALGPPGQLFQAIAGTSMSSPHSAGVAALVKAAHPDWTPGQVKSALMTSAQQAGVTKEDGVTPSDPFDRGAGRIQADRAVNPTVTFDVDPLDYAASASDPLGRIDLNVPSVYAETMSGEVTTWRTARNVSDHSQDLEISTQAPAGVELIVQKAKKKGVKEPKKSDKKIEVAKGKEQTIQITIKAPTVPDGGPYFGQITLDPKRSGYNAVVIPVAFFKQQGAVSLQHTCTPTTFPTSSESECTVTAQNLASVNADTSIEVTADKDLDFANISAPATGTKHAIAWSGTLTPALAPTIDSIASPGLFGYISLSAFSVGPLGGFGDETIANFNVPAFEYGGETYTRLGVVSNGYVVVGGGSASDVDFVPQTFPNAAGPNNVLAPYWTDLDVSAGGTVKVAVLSDGVNSYIVLEWENVPLFGSPLAKRSFQVWIQVGSTEQVVYEFDTSGPGTPDGLTTGAENRDGSSGVNLGSIPTVVGYHIFTSPPTPGGTASFTYDAAAKKAGTFMSTASLTSSVTKGRTQVVQTLTVTP